MNPVCPSFILLVCLCVYIIITQPLGKLLEKQLVQQKKQEEGCQESAEEQIRVYFVQSGKEIFRHIYLYCVCVFTVSFIEYDFSISLCSFFCFFFIGRYIFPQDYFFLSSPFPLLFWVETLASSRAYTVAQTETFSVWWRGERRSDDRGTVDRMGHGTKSERRKRRKENTEEREGVVDKRTERELVLCYTTRISLIFSSLPLSYYFYQYNHCNKHYF